MSLEYGKLVILRKDGSFGPFFGISKDITIGREKTCEIRIKLDFVSRVHTKISVNENGECFLNHLSKTNPTMLNGELVSQNEPISLADGDVISIGERQFIYQGVKKIMNAMKDESNPITKKLSTPVRKEIALKVADKKALNENNSNILLNNIKSNILKNKPKLSQDIKSLIESKRISYSSNDRVINDQQNDQIIKTPKKSLDIQSKRLKTPIRLAIQQMKEKKEANNYQPTSHIRKIATTPRRDISKLKTPLRKAIEARRQSMNKGIQPLVQLDNSDSILKSPINQAIAVRKENRIPSAVKNEILSKRRLTIDCNETNNSVDLPDEEIVINDSNDIIVQPMELSNDLAIAACTQLTIQSFSNEMSLKENLSDEISYNQSIDFFQQDPSAFVITSPHLTKVSKRHRDSIINSISKKAASKIDKAVDKNVDKYKLLSNLSIHELELIDNYAELLSQLDESLDSNQCYELAYDSYIHGIEKYYNSYQEKLATTITTELTNESNSVVESMIDEQLDDNKQISKQKQNVERKLNYNQSDEQVVATTKPPSHEIDLSYGNSLRQLFKLPMEYMSVYNDDYDMDLIEMYANDISNNSFIDEAIAYSLALDTFLADPLEFRRKIGKIEKVVRVNPEKVNENTDATSKPIKVVALTPRRSSRLSTNSKKSITKSTIKKSASKLTILSDKQIDIQRDMSLDIIDNIKNDDNKSKKRQRLSIDVSRPLKRVRRSSTNYDSFEVPHINENAFDESVVDIVVDDEVISNESVDDNISEESVEMNVETDELPIVVDANSTPKEIARKTVQTPATITIQSMEKLLTKSKSKKSISLTDNIELSANNLDSVTVSLDIDSINTINKSDQEIKIDVLEDESLKTVENIELSTVETDLISETTEVTQVDETLNIEAVNTNIDTSVAETSIVISEIVLQPQVIETVISYESIEISTNTKDISEVIADSHVNAETTSSEPVNIEEIEIVSALTTTPSSKPRRSTRSKQEVVDTNDIAESISNEQNVTTNDITVNNNAVKTTDTPNSKSISIASSDVKINQLDTQTPSRSTRSSRNKHLTTPNTVESKRSAKKELIDETNKSVNSKPDKSSKSIGRKRKQVEIIEEALAILCDSCDEEFIMEDIGLTTVPEGDWYCDNCVKSHTKNNKSKVKFLKPEISSISIISPVSNKMDTSIDIDSNRKPNSKRQKVQKNVVDTIENDLPRRTTRRTK